MSDHPPSRPRRASASATAALPATASGYIPVLVALLLAARALALGWRGGDLPGQLFRADLVRREGLVLWNSQWFGGHPTLDYSVLVPVLGALVGPVAVGVVSCLLSAALFDHLLRRHLGRRAHGASVWFAAGTICNLVVGRIAFAVGFALLIGAAVCLDHRRPASATACATAAALSSPVAAVGVVLAALGWASVDRRRWRAAAPVIAGAVVPLALINSLYPTSGRFGFMGWAFAVDLTVCAALLMASGRLSRVVRNTTVLYAVCVTVAFLVPSPLGGNISRFAQFVGGPLLLAAIPRHRRWRAVALAVAVPLTAWQWYPATDAIVLAGRDPSTKAAYYEPLVGFLTSPGTLRGRVEIPPTRRHWESLYVANAVPLARGWERQLDIGYNPIFYEDGALDAASYEAWLRDNGVQYVALPDGPLDDAGVAEAALIRRGLPYLRPAYSDAHWAVWEVKGAEPLVEGPARLVALEPDHITLALTGPGDVFVRVRYSERWALDGPGCIADDGGWLRLSDLRPGPVELRQTLLDDQCPQGEPGSAPG